MEQRLFPRYQLATPLTGSVEQEGARYSGSVLDISLGGFYLHLSKPPQGNLKLQGDDDYGEVHYAGRNAFGFGNLVRVEKFSKGVGVGFTWDRSGMDETSTLLVAELIKEQQLKRGLGHVATADADIILAGHVSSALTDEVFSYLRFIGAGKARLSLKECTSVDSSGIEMLMALRDRGVPIVNVGVEIEGILQRFQLSALEPDKKSNDA